MFHRPLEPTAAYRRSLPWATTGQKRTFRQPAPLIYLDAIDLHERR